MAHVHEEDGGTQFVATGSFDQTVRIWTSDGLPLHTFTFFKAISTLTYVPHHRALWISDGRKVVNLRCCPYWHLACRAALFCIRPQVRRRNHQVSRYIQ